MAEWKRICCAIDFSDASRFAMEKAAELAARLQAELTLLHVNEAGGFASDEVGPAPSELQARAAREIEPKLRNWHQKAEQLLGRPVVAKVLAGSAAAEILRFSREGSFDLLVMGTHGRVGLAHFVVGSVAEEVMRRAVCPVLVVRGAPTDA